MIKENSIRYAHLHSILTPYLKLDSRLEISVPWMRGPIFSISTDSGNGSELSILCDRKQWNRLIRDQPKDLSREMPGFSVIQELLIQSGINPYPNRNSLLALLQKISREKPFQRPLYLSLDTNLLRDRFYATQRTWMQALADQRIGIVLSPYISHELTFTRRKYRERLLRKFADAAENDGFRERILNFRNQNSLEDRRRRLGFLQLESIRQLQWYSELPVLDEDELQESADGNIILTLQRAVEEQNIDILLLSRDQDFIAMAEGLNGIRPFLLKTPKQLYRNVKIDNPQQLADLIYCSAITYGVIGLTAGTSGLLLSGIWTGKGNSDWLAGRLQIIWRSHDKFINTIRRNLSIMDALRWPASNMNA